MCASERWDGRRGDRGGCKGDGAAVMVTMATAAAATAAVVIAAAMAAEAGRAPAVVAVGPCKTPMAMRVVVQAMGGAEGMKQKRGGRCLRGG